MKDLSYIFYEHHLNHVNNVGRMNEHMKGRQWDRDPSQL